MKKLLYNIATISLSVLAVSTDLFAVDKSARLLSSSDSGLRFSVGIDAGKLSRRVLDDGTVQSFRTVTIATPVGASVELLSADGFGLQLIRSESKADKFEVAPALVMIGRPFLVRGRQLVNIGVHPIISGAVYESVEVALRFVGGSSVVDEGKADKQFDRILSSTILNFDQARNWKSSPRPALKSGITADPFSETSEWMKLEVDRTGIYKISGARLNSAGLNLSGLASSRLRLFNGGGLPLPIDNNMPRPSFEEVSIYVADGGDGQFGTNDYFLFFGESVDRWQHTPIDSFVNNPYTTENVYWLSVSPSISGSPARIPLVNYTGTIDTTIITFKRFVHTESDELLQRYYDGEIFDYYNWYWSDQSSLSIHISTPGAVGGTLSNLFLAGKTYGSHMDLFVGGIPAINKSCDNFRCTFDSRAVRDGLTSLVINQYGNSNVAPYFDFVDIAYNSSLVPQSNRIDLTLGTVNGGARLNVTDNFVGSPAVFDVSDPFRPRYITSVSRSGGILGISADLNAANYSRLIVDTSYSDIVISMVTSSALRADLSQTDLMIISPKVFQSGLQDYVNMRSSDYSIRMVALEDIIDNFSFGLYDPAAIRDYLHFAYDNFAPPAPTYVLLAGDGSFDFMDILNTGQPNYVPPFIHPLDTQKFYSDDSYVYFGAYGLLDGDTSYVPANPAVDRGFDMITARWPVSSADEIGTVIGKIGDYENSDNFGPWRARVSIVADDEFAGANGPYNEAIHTRQAEFLEQNNLPAEFERMKIYLWDYPRVGSKRPEVNDAIVDAFNEGTLVMNYIGHGNPELWAHEHVFTRSEDLPRLDNQERLPLVFTASCEIAFFDNPQREGMAEDLLTLPTGAVGVVSATRQVFAGPNALLNRSVYDIMFADRDLSICEALYTAKLQRQYISGNPVRVGNDQAYLFFGDPVMRLGIPHYDLVFDSLPHSITALAPLTAYGRVVDGTGATVPVDGQTFFNAFDGDRRKKHYILNQLDPSAKPLDSVEYVLNGPSIFRGNVTVDNGSFVLTFIPPLDIAYGGSGAKITGYADLGSTDGFGIAESLSVAGTIAQVSDSTGPEIGFSVANRKDFIPGDFIAPGDLLQVDISDPVGVNLTGGIGHGIVLEIDGKSDDVSDLTDLFQYNLDDYTAGSLVYEIAELELGRHEFKIKAWDNANNFSTAKFAAEVVVSSQMAIRELLNYPNPMADSTRFSYYLTQPASSFYLEIFTLSGRKIRTFSQTGRRAAGYYDDIVWHGDDFAADRVATGVYIYKARAISDGGGVAAESFGKIVLIN